MVEYHLGLTPGVIVGLILILLVLTAMLVSTVIVVWRSRPSALARAQQRQAAATQNADGTTPDLESGVLSDKLPPTSILKKTTTSSSTGADGDADSDDSDAGSLAGSPDPQTPRLPGVTSASTMNVIIATDGAGGIEVRVTPPTPSQSMAALKAERRVRFEAHGPPGSPQNEHNESVWWFI